MSSSSSFNAKKRYSSSSSTEKRQKTSIIDLLQRRTDQLVADSRANPPVPAASNSAEAEDTELSDMEEKKRVVRAVQVVKQAISP